jgi:predicted  nucleic acid-binding Zn-ribbon protein
MPHQCTSCGHVFADGSKEMLSGCPDCGGTKFQFHPDGADVPDEPGDAEPPDPPAADDSVAGTVGSAAATVKDLVGRGSSGSAADSGAGTSGSSTAPWPEDDPTPDSDENVGGVALETEDDTDTGIGASDARTSTSNPEPTVSGDTEPTVSSEDSAQASARTDVVSPDELPETDDEESPVPQSAEAGSSAAPPAEGTVVDEPDDPEDRPDLEELRKELNEQFESIKVVSPGHYELNLMELYDREEYIIALQEDGKYTIQVPDRWQE